MKAFTGSAALYARLSYRIAPDQSANAQNHSDAGLAYGEPTRTHAANGTKPRTKLAIKILKFGGMHILQASR